MGGAAPELVEREGPKPTLPPGGGTHPALAPQTSPKSSGLPNPEPGTPSAAAAPAQLASKNPEPPSVPSTPPSTGSGPESEEQDPRVQAASAVINRIKHEFANIFTPEIQNLLLQKLTPAINGENLEAQNQAGLGRGIDVAGMTQILDKLANLWSSFSNAEYAGGQNAAAEHLQGIFLAGFIRGGVQGVENFLNNNTSCLVAGDQGLTATKELLNSPSYRLSLLYIKNQTDFLDESLPAILNKLLSKGGEDVLEEWEEEIREADRKQYSNSFHSLVINPALKGQLSTPLPPDRMNVSSDFGWRIHPTLGSRRFHSGTDFAAPFGTPIFSVLDGVVEKIVPEAQGGGYGNYIQIKHADGSSTLYAHCSRILPNLGVGVQVQAGQQIAEVGSTGRSTGPHLHFEHILPNGEKANPQNSGILNGGHSH